MSLALLRIVRCEYHAHNQCVRLIRASSSWTPQSGQQKKDTNIISSSPTASNNDNAIVFSKTSKPPGTITPDSNKPPNNKPKKPATGGTKTKSVVQNVEGYVFTRFIDYVKNYDKVLEKSFPRTVKTYRNFVDGFKLFYDDVKSYLKISRIASNSPDGLRALNRKEIELYMKLPRDMYKVAPALIGCSLPVVGYAILPLVFMYPATFLTSQFWTIQQRSEFQRLEMQRRLTYNRPVLRALQAKLDIITERNKDLNVILGLLGSGFHPKVSAILNTKEIFAKPPFSLLSLSRKHVKLLNNMYGLPRSYFTRHRLREHAFFLHHMDLAIIREGGVHNMPVEAMKYACFLRGLNPVNLSTAVMVEWLRNWIKVSTSIQEEHISLFLHLPLFLAYNNPNNWQLIYMKKPKRSLLGWRRS